MGGLNWTDLFVLTWCGWVTQKYWMMNTVLVVMIVVYIWAEPKICLCWYIRLVLYFTVTRSIFKDCLYSQVLDLSTFTFNISAVSSMSCEEQNTMWITHSWLTFKQILLCIKSLMYAKGIFVITSNCQYCRIKVHLQMYCNAMHTVILLAVGRYRLM